MIKCLEYFKKETAKQQECRGNNISFFMNIFKNDQTLISREFQNKHLNAAQCFIFYIDGMVNIEIDKIVSSVVNGDTLFLLEGYDKALIISSKGWLSRAISEPDYAKVVRGPREGFTESIMVNLSIVRRKIKSPDLKFKELGERTRTKTCICYIEGLAADGILSELEKRLEK